MHGSLTRPVPLWLRRILGGLALGGGAIGLLTVLLAYAKSQDWLSTTLCLVFAVMYGYGIVCGTIMIEGRPSAARWNRFYWLAQIPVFTIWRVSFEFVSGFQFLIRFELLKGTTSFATTWGSQWWIYLAPSADLVIGFNLFAVAVVVLLGWYLPRAAKAEPTPTLPSSSPPPPPSLPPAPTSPPSAPAGDA